MKNKFKEIRSFNELINNLNNQISLKGLVYGVDDIFPFLRTKVYECLNCGSTIYVNQKYGASTREEEKCDKCGYSHLYFNENASKYEDMRKIILIEKKNNKCYDYSKHLIVLLKGDFIKSVHLGDRIKVMGTPKLVEIKEKSVKNLLIEAEKIEPVTPDISEEDFKRIKKMADDPNILDKLVISFAPGIKCQNDLKLALILQLFSVTNKWANPNTFHRSNFHILIVGDSSEDKKCLLQFVSEISPIGIYLNASNPSLTVEGNITQTEQTLIEAGALKLADKGILCVDGIQNLKKEQLDFMEACMHLNFIDSYKSYVYGIQRTNTSIFASTSPIMSYDIKSPVSNQVDLKFNLLAYFDLIFYMEDEVSIRSFDDTAEYEIIPLGLFKKYVDYANTYLDPVVPVEVKNYIRGFIKSFLRDNKISRYTNHNFKGFLHLSKAFAKIHLRPEVTLDDAKQLVSLIESNKIRRLI